MSPVDGTEIHGGSFTHRIELGLAGHRLTRLVGDLEGDGRFGTKGEGFGDRGSRRHRRLFGKRGPADVLSVEEVVTRRERQFDDSFLIGIGGQRLGGIFTDEDTTVRDRGLRLGVCQGEGERSRRLPLGPVGFDESDRLGW